MCEDVLFLLIPVDWGHAMCLSECWQLSVDLGIAFDFEKHSVIDHMWRVWTEIIMNGGVPAVSSGHKSVFIKVASGKYKQTWPQEYIFAEGEQ